MVELITVVDKNDNVIRGEDRNIVHSSEAWHRIVDILIFNSKGEILIRKRSAFKKYPNLYDVSVAGHVDFGEEYEIAALREMREELGIKTARLKQISHFRLKFPKDNEISKMYSCVYDGKIKPNEEISEIKFFKIDELKKLIVNKPEIFAPWAVKMLRWYFRMENNLDIISVLSKV